VKDEFPGTKTTGSSDNYKHYIILVISIKQQQDTQMFYIFLFKIKERKKATM
jgi:hypothetical protein